MKNTTYWCDVLSLTHLFSFSQNRVLYLAQLKIKNKNAFCLKRVCCWTSKSAISVENACFFRTNPWKWCVFQTWVWALYALVGGWGGVGMGVGGSNVDPDQWQNNEPKSSDVVSISDRSSNFGFHTLPCISYSEISDHNKIFTCHDSTAAVVACLSLCCDSIL